MLLSFFSQLRGLWHQWQEDVHTATLRDPALHTHAEALFCSAGVQALLLHRLAFLLHQQGLPFLARLLHRLTVGLTNVDIHPAARLGRRLFIDHCGAIIGETSILGDDVTLIGRVCLGSKHLHVGGHTKRHPTLGNGVVVGMNATILGDITIGDECIIGANSVITQSLPAECTAIGSPAMIVRYKGERLNPSVSIKQLQQHLMTCATQ